MLSVSFAPEFDHKSPQIVRALPVGEGELKEPIFALWPQHYKLRKFLNIEELAHEQSRLLTAIDCSDNSV